MLPRNWHYRNEMLELAISMKKCLICECFCRNPGGSLEVLIVSSGVSTEGAFVCQLLEASRQGERGTFSHADWRSFWSETNPTLNCYSCTTERMQERSLRESQLSRGKHLSMSSGNLARFSYCRKSIVLRAKEMGIRLTNGNAKLKKVSAEWAGSTRSEKTWS